MAKRQTTTLDPFEGQTPDDFTMWLKKKEVQGATIKALRKDGFNTFRKFAEITPPDIKKLGVNSGQQRLLGGLADEALQMKEGKIAVPRRGKTTIGRRPGPQGNKGSKGIPGPSTSGQEVGVEVEEANSEARREIPGPSTSGQEFAVKKEEDNNEARRANERKRRSFLEEELDGWDAEKRRRKLLEEPGPAASVSFGRSQDHALDVGTLNKVLQKVPASVGIIMHGPWHVGTGFRVGCEYIMTCLHVVRKGDTGSEMLKDLHIKFNYTSVGNAEQGSLKLTHLKYHDSALDVAIVKIDGADQLASSPPLQLSRGPQKGPLYLLGHPGFGNNTPQMIDPNIEVVRRENFTPDFISKVDSYYEVLLQKCNSESDLHKVFHKPGVDFQRPTEARFDGMLDDNCHIIHTAFLPGASGSPGVVVDAAGEMTVRLMLCRGFPAFYYKLTDAERALHPMPDQKYRFEHGLDLTKLYEKMLQSAKDDDDKSLIDEIFG